MTLLSRSPTVLTLATLLAAGVLPGFSSCDAPPGAAAQVPDASRRQRLALPRGTNEPPGMTTFIDDDGSVLVPPGMHATDPWSGANGWGSTHTALVSDPGNPTGSGSAIEKRWTTGTGMDAAARPGLLAVWHWSSIDPAFPPASTLYVRLRVWFSDNWPAGNGDLGGMKFFYLKTSRTSANVAWTSRNPDGRLHWATITRHGRPGNYFFDTWSRGAALLPDGAWHTVEFVFAMNSAPNVPDGRVRMWVDGEVAADRDGILFVGAADNELAADFDGIQFFPLRGSAGARLDRDDRFRLGELYVSGKP